MTLADQITLIDDIVKKPETIKREEKIKNVSYMAIPGVVVLRRKVSQPSAVIKGIINTVCEYYNVTEKQLKGKGQDRQISYPRHVAMYLIYKYCRANKGLFAEYFNRDRSAAAKAYRSISGMLDVYGHVRNQVAEITLKAFS